MKFSELNEPIFLYHGEILDEKMRYSVTNKKFIGLSLVQDDTNHIQCDIKNGYPLKDDCVFIYQSEEQLMKYPENILINLINEIYRILKPDGLFRLSLPDYNCDVLRNRSIIDEKNNVIFDEFVNGKLTYDYNGDIVREPFTTCWYPTKKKVEEILLQTKFKNIEFIHYYQDTESPITNEIDYSLGFVKRTPDYDNRVMNPYRPMSIVVDCYKE